MSSDGPKTPAVPAQSPAPGKKTSGEGASTALEALIRKRKQVESPDEGEPAAPLPNP